MTYSALEVAKHMLTHCFNAKSPINNLRLQLLLYFIQGKSYEIKGKPLFKENVAAWQFGPVVPDVYYEFCVYAGTPILNSYDTKISADDEVIINSVINTKKNIPTWKLVEETHATGTPWSKIYNEQGNRSVIPKDLIRVFLRTKGGLMSAEIVLLLVNKEKLMRLHERAMFRYYGEYDREHWCAYMDGLADAFDILNKSKIGGATYASRA